MKTNKWILGGLMAMAITACTSDELVENTNPTQGKKVTVTAYAPGDEANSRVSFDDDNTSKVTLTWKDSESFSVVYNTSVGTFSKSEEGNTFTGVLPYDEEIGQDYYYAVYPALSANPSLTTANTVPFDLSEQKGALDESKTYMYASSESGLSYQFKHLTAILKATFANIPAGAKISKVVVKTSHEDSKVDGNLDLATGAISGGSKNTITINYATAVDASTPVYIYLPPMAAAKKALAFEVSIEGGDSYTGTLGASTPQPIEGESSNANQGLGIVAGKLYVANVTLSGPEPEPVPVDLPIGDQFNNVVKKALSDNSGTQAIKFVPRRNKAEMDAASFFLSNNNMPDNVKYNVVDATDTAPKTLEIITDADIFNFNALCRLMFASLTNITSIDFNGCVNTANVTNMESMFKNSSSLTSLDLSSFNTEQVTTMQYMFKDCGNLTSLNLSRFNTSNVTNMCEMFVNCKVLETLDLGSFNTSNVTDMQYMFSNCSSLTSLILSSSFNTSNVTDMQYMFKDCKKLTSLDLSSFNTSNVTNMASMFQNSSSLTSLDLSRFNTEKVTTMQYMFNYCEKLSSLNLSSFNTANVTDMQYMFKDCKKITSLDLSIFNTEKVTNMQYMFSNCSSLTSLNLSSFRPSIVTTMANMFYGCAALSTLNLGTTFFTTKVENMSEMFYGVKKLTHDLDLTKFSFNNITSSGAYKLLNGFSFEDNNLKVLVSSDGYNYLNSKMNSSYRSLLKVAY